MNRLMGRIVYKWCLISADGEAVTASSGAQVNVENDLQELPAIDYVFVCSGVEVGNFNDEYSYAWLRKMSKRGVKIGALSTATFVLARAGMLNGYKCTVHWESLIVLQEQYPGIRVTTSLYEIDRNRITCAGATACIDLMLHLIGERFDYSLVTAVSEQYNLSLIRRPIDDQRMPSNILGQFNHPKIVAAVSIMESNIDEPLELGEIAHRVCLSKRQLERLFARHNGNSVIRHYRFLRLRRANQLLTQTGLLVRDVAIACGYLSMSHFSKDYRKLFGHSPVKERTSGRHLDFE
ncbi:MAG: GlxA family transcriptional regulator [Gammaproteobacteria bacterium]|nr:GlxA family transcriptional regulator [Gammaproteobacteria bacterium]